jgi:CDP-paratose 2-epimerase
MKRPPGQRARNHEETPRKAGPACGGQRVGMVECFFPGEYERVEATLADLKSLGVEDLRTTICWADWYRSEGDGWYAWLLPRLAKEVSILPCFLYTPPSLGIVPKISSPPRTPKAYADFLDVMITRFGRLFEWIEFWTEPNNIDYWDYRLDPGWEIFCEMIGGAAYWARKRGKKTVLPGAWPPDCRWLKLMFDRGVMAYVDAVGIHGFPGVSEHPWSGWTKHIQDTQSALAEGGSAAQIWITEAGYSTWREDERAQLRAFAEAVEAPVPRVYWKALQDRAAEGGALRTDERDCHFGLKQGDGKSKLLFQVWARGGIEEVRDKARADQRARSTGRRRHVLITGGAGFLGANLAHRLLSGGQSVLLFDNLSRPGTERNLHWLQERYGDRVHLEAADVRDAAALRAAVRAAKQVFHFAAQVAVTSSLIDPTEDFEVNVRGTLNLLEALRKLECPAPLLFTSTNKVYGPVDDIPLQANGSRYCPLSPAAASISEERRLDFHSPYGCSKGAADQYVLDYARTFGLPAVVFRMSCVYGPHQMGTEDQGWVAHFLIRSIEGKPIMLYGNGLQVRDLLYVDDLVDAFLLAHANIHSISGQAFNIGGGLGNTMSLLELIEMIDWIDGKRPQLRFGDPRPGDQRYYVSDTRKFQAATGWAPKVCARQGIQQLYRWLAEGRSAGRPHPAAIEGIHEILAS